MKLVFLSIFLLPLLSFAEPQSVFSTNEKPKSKMFKKKLKNYENAVVVDYNTVIIEEGTSTYHGPSIHRYRNYTNKPVQIPHPNAAKGLKRITSDGTYIYETEKSPQTGASGFRLGVFEPTNLQNEVEGATVTYNDIYGESTSPMLTYEHEWKLTSKFGHISFSLGTGIFTAQGNGRLVKSNIAALEVFTLVGFPNTANLIYRFQYSDSQWFVPYVSGGAGVFAFTEVRDDGTPPKFGAAYYGHGSAGIGLSLASISRDAAATMDRDYGINNTWLVGEFRRHLNLGGRFDISGNYINAGLLLEY